jgi:hypothetical protein
MENIFPEGSGVYAKEDPTCKLLIRRYVDRVYYCKVQRDPSLKERVYFERELIPLQKRPLEL